MARPPADKPAASPVDAAAIRELAEIIADTGLTEIELERGDLRIRVAKDAPAQMVTAVAGPGAAAPAPAPTPAPAATPETPAPRDAADAAHPGAVTSPMVGTVYLASDPDSPPFAAVGQTVKAGDTLLLIEAMKTFNPIEAPKAGKVIDILVTDSQPVEFGETLVIIG